MNWQRLSPGTMQCLPDLNHTYQIVKLRHICADQTAVLTYLALKQGEKDWWHLGSADTFEEAKAYAAKDWQLGLSE